MDRDRRGFKSGWSDEDDGFKGLKAKKGGKQWKNIQ